ncbi:hypothetical protein KY342_02475 [Candidatus Woesearchaeota archaeon]|nr:hypothetical protein [Candidatus Woesearchaeota archaeon]
MLKKKAIIFSLDAIFAIVIAGIMILACFFYLSKTTTNLYQNQDIYKLSLDSLTILEKDETLKTAIETSSATTIQQFLNSLPDQHCGNITVYTSLSTAVLSSQKTGCTANNESTIAIRSFIANNSNIYYAKMEAWYK